MFVGGPRPNGRGPDGRWIPKGEGRRGAGSGSRRPERRPAGAALPDAVGQRRRRARQPHKMPSHGFYVRHVKGIQFDNIEIQTEKDDLRPAFVLEDVQDADFFRIKAPHAAGVPVFALHNISDFSVAHVHGVPDTQLKTAETTNL